MSGDSDVESTGSTDESSHDDSENEFSMKTLRTDLSLIVEDRLLYVSKTVLALVSPVFEAMFDTDFKERIAGELPLPGKKYEDVLEFLRCIYPNIQSPITQQNVHKILPLADEYQVKKLKYACESILLEHMSDNMPTRTLFAYITKASTFNLSRVYDRGLSMASRKPSTVLDDVDMLSSSLKDTVRLRILHRVEKECNNLTERNTTSDALLKFFSTRSSEKSIVDQHMKGMVVGKSIALRLRSPYNDQQKLNVGGHEFNLQFSVVRYAKTAYTSDQHIAVGIDHISCTRRCRLDCFGVFVIKNWMKNNHERSIYRDHKCNSKRDGQSIKFELQSATITEIEDESKGFILDGIVNIEVHLFVIRKSK